MCNCTIINNIINNIVKYCLYAFLEIYIKQESCSALKPIVLYIFWKCWKGDLRYSVPVFTLYRLIVCYWSEKVWWFPLTELYFLICLSLSQVSGWKSGLGLPGDLLLEQKAPAVCLCVCESVCFVIVHVQHTGSALMLVLPSPCLSLSRFWP